MSQHPSLKRNLWKTKRTVRKRYERLRSLMLQKKWDKEHSNIFKLAKEKIIRLKVKKEKKEEKLEAPLLLSEIAKQNYKKKKSNDDKETRRR